MNISQHEESASKTNNQIVELRQYTLYPGKRDVLIDLFDREFVETQEGAGIEVIGQFKNLDDPDTFVWLRSFPSMIARAKSLEMFYGGPVWKAHRDAANATMIDSDNVFLLRPAHPDSGFALEEIRRPPPGSTPVPDALVVATIYELNAPADEGFLEFFERDLIPVFTASGTQILAYFVTEESPNTFPKLPVLEGKCAFVWFSIFPNGKAYERYAESLTQSQPWNTVLKPALDGYTERPPKTLRLMPTSRSRLGF